MSLNNSRPTSYSDGVAAVYRLKESRNAFGAAITPTSASDMDLVAKLAFASVSIRAQDYNVAEQRGFNVERKIRTRRLDDVDAECKAVIDGWIYDVSYIDKEKRELFVYLDGGRPFGDS